MTAAEARYLHAFQAARRAWERSQPQFVIPGVLEGGDATRADGDNGCGVASLEPACPLPDSPAGGLDNPTKET